jgi:hypothetical protein
MRIVKALGILGALAMTGVLIYGFGWGDFSSEGGLLLSMPWGIVSLVDLYVGFVLFSGWILYRERSVGIALAWIVLVMVLGFFTASVYVVWTGFRSRGDWTRFWMGARAPGTGANASGG